jgi:peptidoglycan/xylan/chitin deacetylase (PgdA/CDA1 family)
VNAGGERAPAAAAAIPILLYHSVSDVPQPGLDRWTVSPSRFREHVRAIADSGRVPLTVSDLACGLRGTATLPKHSVVVTFDDGYLDTLAAVECLLEASIPATVYLTGEYLGRPGMLGRSDVAELGDLGSGVEVGAHALTHRRLDELSRSRIEHELAGSRTLVADLVQRKCQTFAYPHGAHDRRVVSAVRATGYSSAAAVKNALSSPADNVFALARVTIEATATTSVVVRALNGKLPLARSGEALRTRTYRWARRLRRLLPLELAT